jgi:hypothetical protein
MAKSATYSLTIDGESYSFNDDEDLTVSALRHIKAWYPALGTYATFRVGYLQGDPDALACVRWIVLRRAGKANVPEPRQMPDFALGEFMNSWLGEDNEPCLHCGGVDEDGRRVPGRGWNPRTVEAEEPDPTEGRDTSATPGSPTATRKSSAASTSAD